MSEEHWQLSYVRTGLFGATVNTFLDYDPIEKIKWLDVELAAKDSEIEKLREEGESGNVIINHLKQRLVDSQRHIRQLTADACKLREEIERLKGEVAIHENECKKSLIQNCEIKLRQGDPPLVSGFKISLDKYAIYPLEEFRQLQAERDEFQQRLIAELAKNALTPTGMDRLAEHSLCKETIDGFNEENQRLRHDLAAKSKPYTDLVIATKQALMAGWMAGLKDENQRLRDGLRDGIAILHNISITTHVHTAADEHCEKCDAWLSAGAWMIKAKALLEEK